MVKTSSIQVALQKCSLGIPYILQAVLTMAQMQKGVVVTALTGLNRHKFDVSHGQNCLPKGP